MRDFSKDFYLSKAWIDCRNGFMSSKNFVCERCGGVGTIAHHRIWLSPGNIHDPNITLSWDNLECLCYECHAIEHMAKRTRLYFDNEGDIEKVKESSEIREFKRAQKDIDRLLSKLKKGERQE